MLKLTVLPQIWLGSVPRHECEDGPRPCRRIDCRYHLWSEVTTTERSQPGRIGAMPRATVEESKQRPSCAIDVADDGPKSLGEIAAILGVTREGVRLIEARAKRKLEASREEIWESGMPIPRSRY